MRVRHLQTNKITLIIKSVCFLCLLDMSRKRNYRNDFIEYGFTSIMDKDIEKPQCVICLKILCPESMKASKLKDHLNRTHPLLLSKPREFFERQADTNKIQRLDAPGKDCVYD